MSYGTRTQFTVVANLISNGNAKGALGTYLNTFNRFGLTENPDRPDIVKNLGHLFGVIAAQDPLYAIEQAVGIREACPEAEELQNQAIQLFMANVPRDLENLSKQEFTTEAKDRVTRYAQLAGKLIAGSSSDDERETCLGIYRQTISIIAAHSPSDALFTAGLTANNCFPNPSDEQKFSDIYIGLIHETAKREGPKKAAWNASFTGDHVLRPGIFQTAVTKIAMHYLEEALQDESISKAGIINRLGYHFTRSPSNPLLAAETQNFYLRNVHLAAEEAPLDTYVAAEKIRSDLKNADPAVIDRFDQLLSLLEKRIRFVSSHAALGRSFREAAPTNTVG